MTSRSRMPASTTSWSVVYKNAKGQWITPMEGTEPKRFLTPEAADAYAVAHCGGWKGYRVVERRY